MKATNQRTNLWRLIPMFVLGCMLCPLLLQGAATPSTEAQPTVAAADEAADEGDSIAEVESSFDERLGDKIKDALDRGWLLYAFLIAFLGGLFTSLMGCVYPLIPVAMAVIGTREAKSRWNSLTLSLTYVGGMCMLYTSLGLTFAALGKEFGSWLGSPWVIGLIMAFLVAMGLSMIGVYEIRLPSFIEQRLNRVGGKGYKGAFLAGLVSGLLAAPCTGPVLTVILAFILKSQNLFLGFWLLLFFSLGVGFLFLLIGTFSSVVTHLPKSGSWMEGIKSGFGILMIGMSGFFLAYVLPSLKVFVQNLIFPGWIGLSLLAVASIVGGLHISLHDDRLSRKIRKIVGVVLGSVGVFLIAASLTLSKTEVKWEKDLQQAIKQARTEQRPVMLDFWATWCPACIKLDQKTFSSPQVAAALDRFVAVKIDCTGSAEDEAIAQIMEKYDALDLPTIRFIDSQGRLLDEPVIKGFVNAKRMLQLLTKIP